MLSKMKVFTAQKQTWNAKWEAFCPCNNSTVNTGMNSSLVVAYLVLLSFFLQFQNVRKLNLNLGLPFQLWFAFLMQS